MSGTHETIPQGPVYTEQDPSFNLDALVSRIEEHLSEKVTQIEDYLAGAHHWTYKITLEKSGLLLVRVSYAWFPIIGYSIVPKEKMRSEIATLRYVGKNTRIPVPFVLMHDTDIDGAVGGEWMLMEFVPGSISLLNAWPTMTPDQHRRVADSIADIWSQLLHLRLDAIGSLYEVASSDQVVVGPMTFPPSDNVNDRAQPIAEKCGPFASARQWLVALARRELDFIKKEPFTSALKEQISTVAQHIEEATPLDSSEDAVNALALEHVDLCPHNILVDLNDPTRILSVIDWEGARVVPLWAIDPSNFLAHCAEQFGNDLEILALDTSVREEVMRRVPLWKEAMEATDVRVLHAMARVSAQKPAYIQESIDYTVKRGILGSWAVSAFI
ncbi:hypothetical protein PLICRDRAFT_42208 [Plicaturopsis crispa FD-325 SS-3]|nr:hypothetical protein PLICRDRAFT_42208 [Plicaturopsis crispa FD-325 SS-3]